MPLVTLRSYRDAVDAELAAAQLAEAGIPVFLQDRYLASIQWLYSRAIGGIKVRVDSSQLEAARAVLSEDRSAELAEVFEGRGAPEPDECCPACGSTSLHTSRLRRRAGALSLLTGLPFVAWRRRWLCEDCGHAWKPPPAGRARVPAETLEADRRVHEARRYPVVRALLGALLGLAILHYVQVQIRGG